MVASLGEALGSGGTCPTAPANQTHHGHFPAWPGTVSSANYGTADCSNAYFIDLVHLHPYTTASPFDLIGPETLPSNSECANTRIMVYGWEREDDGDLNYLGNMNDFGQFTTFCSLRYVPVGNFNLTTGHTYHFAVSVRRYQTMNDPSSSYVTKKIRLFNDPDHL